MKSAAMDETSRLIAQDAVRCKQECKNDLFSECSQPFQVELIALLSQLLEGGWACAYLEEGLPLYQTSETFLSCMGYTKESFQTEAGGLLLASIHPEDRACYQATVQGAAQYDLNGRMCHRDGSTRWMREIGMRILLDDGKPALLCIRQDNTQTVECQEQLKRQLLLYEDESSKLADITANIPGGVCEMALDENLTLLYGNEGFYTLIGYEPEQLRQMWNNQTIHMFNQDERQELHAAITTAYQQQQRGLAFERRIYRGDGQPIWILFRANFSFSCGCATMNCVVIDITDRKQMEEELRINEERFRIALSQTDSTIFEYNMRTSVMIHADKAGELYGIKQYTEHVPESLVEAGVIHPDSVQDFLNLYSNIRNGAPTDACVIRTRLVNGTFVWRKISMTTIFDGDQNPVRAVGMLEDIDAQTRREQALRDRSERDTLTGLLNKGATEMYIKKLLQKRQDHLVEALFVIDVDLFKAVNDQFGHLFGDFVLTESAKRISSLFHGEDVIGRIGGDEFIVCMGRLPACSTAYRRAKKICSIFHAPFTNNGTTAFISCSIGVAFCPQDGITFQELYQKADIALYEAKRHGKDRCMLFSPEMIDNTTRWIPYSSTAIDTEEPDTFIR